MAKRPIFIPFTDGIRLVREESIEFRWNPGMAPVQKKKNIVALHEAAKVKAYAPLLEISTKSDRKLGVRLSAFNMPLVLRNGTTITLECAFHGSKVFERGGPFQDIYCNNSWAAKKDQRIRESGAITGFLFEETVFPTEPKTAFYDWLYACALKPHKIFLEALNEFAGFTDIEFNPIKSINCQARACAIFVSLCKKDLLEYAISSPQKFIEVVAADSWHQPYSSDGRQGKLL